MHRPVGIACVCGKSFPPLLKLGTTRKGSVMKTYLLAMACYVLVTVGVFAQPVNYGLLTFTNIWRYDQSGSNNSTVWRGATYDDSAWQQGAGFFGVYTNTPYTYPAPIQTPLTLGGGRITYYFRTHFNFPSNTVGFALVASNYVDDGAVFYLNGTEVGRVRMTNGVVGFQTHAASAAPGGPVQVLTFSSGSLVPGDNVLAVEIHQTATTNLDILFGMNLTAIIKTNLAHKILVDGADTNATGQLAAGGGTNLANYASFSLWSVTASQAPPALLSAPSITIRFDFDAVPIRGGLQINPQTGTPGIPANLSQVRTNSFQFWMVHYAGPIQNAWLSELTNTGVQIVWYTPANGYIVWGNLPSLTNLDNLATQRPYIIGDYAYHPYYRLEASLQQAASSQPSNQMVNVTVQVFNSPHVNQTLASLQSLGGQVWLQPASVQQLSSISLQLPAGQLRTVANWSDVYNVEPWTAPTLQDEVQGQILADNVVTSGLNIVPQPTTALTYTPYRLWLLSKGFSLKPSGYPIVDVVDDGIDNGLAASPAHPDFYYFGNIAANESRIAYIQTATTGDADPAGGQHGHGNLNAGIVAAYNNGTGYPYLDAKGFDIGIGVSPLGRVAGTKIFKDCLSCGPEHETFDISATGNTWQGLVGASYTAGADLTSDSWGAASHGQYDATAQAYDSLTRNASSSAGLHEMLHVVAAGNQGPGITTGNSPGTAKNVLTVGATENVRNNGTLDGSCVNAAANADNVIYFSSRGPTADGRYKPDIMAPGTHVQGPASQDADYDGLSVSGAYVAPCGSPHGAYFPTSSSQTLYTWSSGTSHSTPAVSGAVSLIYEHYPNLLKFQNGANPPTPSPAMLKALVINSSRYLKSGNYGSDTLPSNNQGWGDVDLGLAFDGTPRLLVDQTQTFTDSIQPSYTYPGSVSVYDATKPVRVTLVWSDAPGNTTTAPWVNDLSLVVTVGGSTYNGNVFSTQYSVPGVSTDNKNNVKNVFLPSGTTGPISVTVIPSNIAAPGVPGNSSLASQDFALVIYNAVQTTTPAADVFIRDDSSDVGAEPNPYTGNYWESPDIWNRLDPAADSTQTHQSPQYGVDNWINVRLNYYGPFSASGVVKLYWGNGSSALSWPTDWNWFADIPVANLMAPITPFQPPFVVNALWHPPGKGHYCITAMWVSGQDPLYSSLTSDVNANTINNNNIAWRNMEIVAAPPGSPVIYSFIMRNPGGSGTNAGTYNMRIRALPSTNLDTFVDNGQILFDLGPTLYQRWLQAGAQGTGFQIVTNQSGSVFQVLDASGAYINGIPIDPGEDDLVSLTFISQTNQVQTFAVDATQMTVSNAPIGGMTCLVNTGPTIDNVGDGIPDWWRALYFGGNGTTTNTLSCATCDPDNDGFDNLQEYLAGTSPTNALSHFQIDSVAAVNHGTAVQLQFYANSNLTYSVQYKSDLENGTWNSLTNIPALPAGQEITVLDTAVTNGAPRRFYRLTAPSMPLY